MYIRKTMVLSALNESNEKAVLNLESEKDMLVGSVRLYNFADDISGILSLGILCDGKVYKAGLNQKSKGLYTFMAEDLFELSEKFSCAIINVKNGKATPILLGATDGKKVGVGDIKLASSISLLDENPITVNKVTEVLDNNNIDYEEEEKEEIENCINQELKKEIRQNTSYINEKQEIQEKQNRCEVCEDKCLSCKYRDAFYKEGNEIHIEKVEKIKFEEEMVEEVKVQTFYDEIGEQITELFQNYPEESFLVSIIPNSKWVKVDYEDGGEYYVVGLIYENENIKYICYGIPAMYSEEPPKELCGVCQWLPLDPDKPFEFGYWLMYQDAETGENIEINVV